jgi:hypothetical protein
MIDPASPDYTDTPISPRRPGFGYASADPSAQPWVTIVTPFYNTGSIFHETAWSVLQQSLQQSEWIIVDDGSTDPESLALLEMYQHRDPRIRVIIHGTNRGLSAARNTGFRAARAPYVIQLDSDDLLEPTAAEKWVWCLESYPEFAFVKGYTVSFAAQEYLWRQGFHDRRVFLEENSVAPTAAIRTAVHAATSGYDETIRGGLEDWEFWLHCASCGYWGGTIPEYLDWYRRRPVHSDRWANWDNAEHQRAFHARLRQRYPQLWNDGFPQIHLHRSLPNAPLHDELPCANRLQKSKPRLLMIVPGLTAGEADQFNLHVLEQLTQRGWEVSVATTQQGDHSWLPRFARYTPDIFILRHFLRSVDYSRFLHYLLQSRQPEVVLVPHDELGFLLLPYLRAQCPEVTCLDVCHIETLWWKGGGAPLEQRGERLIALLQEARQSHVTQPCPALSPDIGRAYAAQVVEYVQRAEETANLGEDHSQRRSLSPSILMREPRGGQWCMLFYFALRRCLLPYYREALRRYPKWLLPLKNRLKRILLGEVWS